MRRASGLQDVLRAAAESAVYSPVWVVPAILIAEAFAPATNPSWTWLLRKVHETPTTAVGIIGVLVTLRPAVLFLTRLVLATFGIVFISRSWAEALGDALVQRIRKQEPAGDVGATLRARAREGNVDIDHLDATMWLWVVARYDGDPAVERECSVRLGHLVQDDKVRARLLVWCLRAQAKLDRIAPRVLPPICAEVTRRR